MKTVSVFVAEMKTTLRSPAVLFWNYAFPVAIYFIFAASFGLEYIQFLVPGLIGITICSLAMFKSAVGTANARKEGFFRMLFSTGLSPYYYITAHLIVSLLILMVLVVALFTFNVFYYDLPIKANYLLLLGYIAIGSLIFSTIGFLISTLSDNIESVSGMANVLFFSMLFLSGTYFPRDTLPEFLSAFALALPLTPYLEIFRAFWEGTGLSMQEWLLNSGILLTWFVGSIVIARHKFKWKDT